MRDLAILKIVIEQKSSTLRHGELGPQDSTSPEHLVPLQPSPKRATKPAAGRAVPKRAAKSAAQPSSQFHPVPVMPVKRVQNFKVVWSRDKKFHIVPVVDEGAPEPYHLMLISCVAGVLFVYPCNPPPPLGGGKPSFGCGSPGAGGRRRASGVKGEIRGVAGYEGLKIGYDITAPCWLFMPDSVSSGVILPFFVPTSS